MSNRQKLKPIPAFLPPKISLRYNGYLCGKCGGAIASIDLHEGTTPASIQCFATEGCSGKMDSLGYPDGEPPSEIPLWIQWYRPETLEEVPNHLKRHVRNGGLLRMATKEAPDWVKAAA